MEKKKEIFGQISMSGKKEKKTFKWYKNNELKLEHMFEYFIKEKKYQIKLKHWGYKLNLNYMIYIYTYILRHCGGDNPEERSLFFFSLMSYER